jgi:hypothetical protein
MVVSPIQFWAVLSDEPTPHDVHSLFSFKRITSVGLEIIIGCEIGARSGIWTHRHADTISVMK